MHEMSLVEGVRSIIEEQARVQSFSRVLVVRLDIGCFAAVEKAAFGFAWDVVMRGSPAEGAMLEMIDLPGQALCLDCAATVQIDDRLAPCPQCGGERLLPDGGNEMRIRNMEVV